MGLGESLVTGQSVVADVQVMDDSGWEMVDVLGLAQTLILSRTALDAQ